MAGEPLRVAILGGIPSSLGGGGLELQIGRTRAALAARGHEVFHVAQEPEVRPFDVLHAFSTEPDVWHVLGHWRRNAAPLVVSPVCVIPSGVVELRQRLASRIPVSAFAPRMRVEILRRADAIVAVTEKERRLTRALAGRLPRVEVIGNGVDHLPERDLADTPLPDEYVALVGTVSPRKRQLAAIEALGRARIASVVLGGFDGTTQELARFEESVAQSGAVWLGEVSDQRKVQAVVRQARALVHPSVAEGQSQAVLEALAAGTPAVVSALPSNLELAALYPDHIHIARSVADMPAMLSRIRRPARPAPVPTWDDIAEQMELLYRSLLAAG
jgi:glycosyltransferase involved in cell wall biosynthesis